ncbi:type II secretion system protein N [Sphingomonas sp.]|uniref:type II secretion system protein N n=1 Tax=Sphingomonas sp. TaxID=28214 RepID=UPI002ED7D1D6
MRLKLDARSRAILRRLPAVNVYSAAELLLLAGLAVQAARLVWAILTPVSPLGEWRPAAVAEVASPVATLTGFDPFFRLGATAGPAVVTSLQLTLYGIRVDEASGRGSAILAGADGLQRSIAVGEEIQPGVTLKAVAFDHVTIDRGGTAEDLFLDQSGGATPPQPGGALPPQPGAGVTVAQLRQDIGFIPRIDRGRVSGLVVRSQGSGAAFRAAGLRDGDVVTALGGRPVSGADDLERITRDYAAGGNVPITVERGQETLPLAITIAGPAK